MASNTGNLPSTTLPCCIAKVELVLGAGLLSKQQAALREAKEIRLSSKGRLRNWWKRHWPIHQPNLIPENQAEEFGLACSTHSVFLCRTEQSKDTVQLSAQACSGGSLSRVSLCFLKRELWWHCDARQSIYWGISGLGGWDTKGCERGFGCALACIYRWMWGLREGTLVDIMALPLLLCHLGQVTF